MAAVLQRDLLDVPGLGGHLELPAAVVPLSRAAEVMAGCRDGAGAVSDAAVA